MSFGGPYLGFMATRTAMVRKLPGRIAGQTVDGQGKRAFVLTLQAREQHIRREKASSNICSNEAYCALTAGAYMTVMGPQGMREAAQLCASKAAYLAVELNKIGYSRAHGGPFWNEFATTAPQGSRAALTALDNAGILGGLALDDKTILWCVTERNTKAQIDALVAILGGVK